MKLSRVIIKNYRSIKQIEIDFNDFETKFLFGKNGSGKSNILKAIHLLNSINENSYYDFENDPKRSFDDYSSDSSTVIDFVFDISSSQPPGLRSWFSKYFGHNKEFESLEQFMKSSNVQVSLRFDAGKVKRSIHIPVLSPDLKRSIRPNEYAMIYKEGMPSNKIIVIDGKKRKAKDVEIVKLSSIGNYDEIKSRLKPITSEGEFFGAYGELEKLVKASVPNVILWKFRPEMVLSGPVNSLKFAKNPDQYPVFKKLVSLIGLKTNPSIANRVSNALKRRDLMKSLTSKLSSKITSQLHVVWPDYQHLTFEVDHENGEFQVFVRDSPTGNFFRIEDRSDGFQRFVSMLFNLSLDRSAGELSSNIILFDEPENSLHPSGIKCFRNELIRMGKSNWVLAASHSIFMVDKDNIGRHYIVRKDVEDTLLETVNENNFVYEEVIYEALGTSVFELFQRNNFLFEGESDRKLFKLINSKARELQLAHFPFDLFGLCNASGASKVTNWLSFFQGTRTNFIVLLDDDDAGRRELQKINSITDFSGEVYCYEILDHGLKSFTVEDLLPKHWLEDMIQKEISSPYSIVRSDNGVLKELEIYLQKRGDRKEIINKKIRHLKNEFVNDLEDYLRTLEKGRFEAEFSDFITFVTYLKEKSTILNS